MRTHVMTFETLLNDEENQVRGFTYIFDKIRNRFKTHSNLEHLQKSVEPSILPAEYGGSVSTKDCIISWKKELEENRASVLELDTMKVEQGPVEHEHTPVVRKKSRHDSGSQVSNIILNSLKLNTDPNSN